MSHKTFDDPHGTSDRARQGLLDNRCEHGPKRHRTKARKKRISAEKRRKIKVLLAKQNATRTKWLTKVRAYWLGLGDHP